jgi:putative FmdB family regulatory protein
MPIYEYRCTKCGQFEIMQRITDRPLTRCPACQSKVTKLISNTSFQLKGSGWYMTDYARKDGKRDAGKEAKSETKSGTSTEAKTEKKGPSDTKTTKTTETVAA